MIRKLLAACGPRDLAPAVDSFMTHLARRLLFVVNDAGFFLSHRLPIATAARSAGWDVHVATPRSSACGAIRELGFSYHPVHLTRFGMRPIRELIGLASLLRLYRTLRPNLVHHISVKPVLYGGMAARLARVPAVVSAVSGLGYLFAAPDLRVRLLRPAVLWAYARAFAHHNMRAIFQNPEDCAVLEESKVVTAPKMVLIRGSGVDTTVFRVHPEPDGPLVVMFPARILRTKGVLEFVEAARHLLNLNTEWRFVLVGTPDPGNPAGVGEAAIRQWEAEGLIEWWGHRNDMPDVLPKANIICLPSYREGLPKVLLEAAACGRAIVSTHAPGCRDTVVDGKTGLLVPVRDAAALAAALLRLLEDGQLRREMGSRGRVRTEAEFSVQTVVARHLEIYDELAARAAPE